MTSLDWSVPAQNVLHLFYNANVTIYVEGKNDVNFWQHKFEKIAPELKVHVKAVSGENVTSGGQELLKNKMNSIINDQGKFIVATDLDYDDFTNKLPVHPLIIKTYGYAIENSMYCPNIINYAICKKLHNFDFDEIKKIRETLAEDFRQLYQLLVLDIANIYYTKGLNVLGDKSHKYLTNNGNGTKIKEEVVSRKISELRPFFKDEELRNIRNMLK